MNVRGEGKKNSEMNIFVAFNEAYALPTKVMLKSLILNNPVPLTIYVFYSSLEQRSIDSIRELEDQKRVFIHIQKVEDSFLDNIAIPPQFSKETYYRLLAHRLFDKEIERVLWLDGDLIINGPLSDFYWQDFHGKLFAAVEEASEAVEATRILLKMPPDVKYVNSGVMLFNLKDARETLNDEEIIQYLSDNQNILEYADQDVFNGLLHEHILVVDPDHLYNFSVGYTTDEKVICQNARIIHYPGPKKPWRKNYDNLCFSLWWKYALQTDPLFRQMYRKISVSHAFAQMRSRSRLLNPKAYFGYMLWRFKLFVKDQIPGPYNAMKQIYDRAVGNQSREESLHDIYAEKTERRVDH